jgi:uncharacterized protein (TIGR03437 family)
MRILFHFALLLTVIAATGRTQSIPTVANFPDGVGPANIIQGSDGNFYGTASGGTGMCQNIAGTGPCGTVYEVTSQGAVSTLYSFQPGPNATFSYPLPTALIQGTDGNFYGTTSLGGKGCTLGCGTIFKVTPQGSATTHYALDQTHGSSPAGSLVEGTDGNFYGVTSFGGTGTNCTGVDDGVAGVEENGCGTVFKITPQGSLTSLHSFNLTDGATPVVLIQGADGNFYGTTQFGGAGGYCPITTPGLGFLKGCGTVFKITPAGAFTTIYTFQGASDGTSPSALIQTADGNFYGIASTENIEDYGSIFELTPAGVLTTVVVFDGTNGANPNTLLQASDGNLYGTSSGEGGVLENGVPVQQSIGGTLFQLSPTTGTLLTLFNFCTLGCTQPNYVSALSVIQGNDGNLYGISNGITGEDILFRYNLVSPTAPAISANSGVVNGASFQTGIAAGAWMTINGKNLSSQTGAWANSIVKGALPTTLDGVSVMVGDQPAYIEYVSPTQINALVPNVTPNVPAGSVPVTVTTANGTSQAVMAQLSAEQPAFFQWGTYAVATRQNFSLAVKNGTFPGTTTVPAVPGDVIILWGTGFGPTSPSAPAGEETPSTTTYHTATAVSVTVGGKPATVYGAALAPGYAGLYQVAIQIPASLANGDYPVVATISGAQSPATTLITVQK